jgi:hypothetical protein
LELESADRIVKLVEAMDPKSAKGKAWKVSILERSAGEFKNKQAEATLRKLKPLSKCVARGLSDSL